MTKRNIVYNKILIILTCVLLASLFLIDKQYRVNHIFALAIVMIIYSRFKTCSFKRLVYYITIVFAIMGAGLSIPLSESFFLSRFNIYYLFIGIYSLIVLNDICFKKIKISISQIFNKKINIISFLFATYVFGSVIIAQNKSMALKQLFIYVVMFMLFTIVVNENRTSGQRKDSLKVLSYIAIGILILGTFKIVTGIMIEPRSVYTDYNVIKSEAENYMKRIPTVFFYNPNDYAMVVVLILLGYLGAIVSNGIKKSIKYILIYIVGLVNLIYTCSRTGWIGLVLSIILLVVYFIIKLNKESFKNSIIMMVLTMSIFALLAYLPLTKPYYGKFENTTNEVSSSIRHKEIYLVTIDDAIYRTLPNQNKGDNFFGFMIGGENSVNKRVTLVYDVLKGVFTEKRYFGFGVGNTTQYIMEQNNTYGLYVVHNFWFEILGDFGVVGLGLFIFIYVYAFIKLIIRKSKKVIEDNIDILILMAIVPLVFGPSSVVGFTVFWIALAMVYSNVIYGENIIEKEEANEFNK